MTISSPVTLPVTPAPRSVSMTPMAAVGMTRSPFTFEQEIQTHQGACWEAQLEYAPIGTRALAEDLIGALVSLNFREHTLLVRAYPRSPRGTWSDTGGNQPQVNGGSQTGKTLNIDQMGGGNTGKRGDWFQLGSGGSAKLHKLTADFTANGSGVAAGIDFWPPLRSSPADNALITLTNPVGLFRLAEPFSWNVDVAMIYGLSLKLIEAL